MLRFHFDCVDSTNARAAQIAARHSGREVLVSARRQTAGRGRSGRVWQSPPGGAWFTLALPAYAVPEAYEPLPLVVGYAVLRALREEVFKIDADLQIKWPNDVLLGGRKVAGILCQRVLNAVETKARGSGLAARPLMLIGVGINVNLDPAALGPDLRVPATSLHAATGHKLSVSRLIGHCATLIANAKLALERDGFTPADRCNIEANLAWRGEEVAFRRGTQAVRTWCLGLDDHGRLCLEIDGRSEPVNAGEIEHLAAVDAAIVAAAAHQRRD
jgi:BirA family biotin operon repressor/biotin-[acetyl-CoA-carboxylase] ligase